METRPSAGWIEDLRAVAGRTLRDLRDRLHARDIVWHTLPGTDLRLRGGNWIAAGAGHEQAEIALFRTLLDDCDVVVDVGANSGIYSLLAGRAGKRCFAFEPLRANLAILYENLRVNALDAAVEVFPLAASDAVGAARFYGRGQGASLLAGWAGQPAYDWEEVATNTLDNLVAARVTDARVLMKLDVEGAELMVLRGAAHVLARCDAVLLEHSLTRNQPGGLNRDFASLFEFMWAAGFSACVADPALSPVTRERVDSWVQSRATDIATENFLFRRDRSGG